MRQRRETLAAIAYQCEKRIVSAPHRPRDRLFAFAKGAKAAGFKNIIAGDGGAAHCRLAAAPDGTSGASGFP